MNASEILKILNESSDNWFGCEKLSGNDCLSCAVNSYFDKNEIVKEQRRNRFCANNDKTGLIEHMKIKERKEKLEKLLCN